MRLRYLLGHSGETWGERIWGGRGGGLEVRRGNQGSSVRGKEASKTGGVRGEMHRLARSLHGGRIAVGAINAVD